MSKGSTRRYRKARAQVLAYATHCHICGQPARPGDPLVTDHLIPRSAGGPDVAANLAPAHRSCNGRRGARPLEQMRPRVIPRPDPAKYPSLVFKTQPDGKVTWNSQEW